MKTAENQLEQRFAFWPLLEPIVGPIMLLASLTLLFVNFPDKALVFAGVVLLSVAVCWHWTWRGLALSMSLLALGFAYHYNSMDMGEMFWHLGMSGALTLGFVATALASEEMKERIFTAEPKEDNKLQLQLKAQADTLKQLDEQLHASREAFTQQRDQAMCLEQLLATAREELKSLTHEQEELQREITLRKESASRAQQQMAEARSEARAAVEELQIEKDAFSEVISDLKQQISLHQLRQAELEKASEKFNAEMRSAKTQLEGQTRRASFLEEEKLAIQRAWESEKQESQSKLAALSQQIVTYTQQLTALQTQSERDVAKIATLQTQLKTEQATAASLQTQLETGQTTIVCLQKQVEADQAIIVSLQTQAQTIASRGETSEVQVSLLQQNMSVAEAQKIAHWRAMRTAEGKAQQLREQFEEKSAELDATRRDRFIAEERAERYQRELEELQLAGCYGEVKPLLKHIQRMERTHETELSAAQREVEVLEEIVAGLMKKADL